MVSTLWFVRHAESEGNLADERAKGARAERLELTQRDPDVPLSPAGREQAAALGRAWRDLPPAERPTVVLSSPYERAVQTAQLTLQTAGWDVPVQRDERLRERDLGLLDGFTRYGIEARFPEEAERRARLGKFYYRPPGGESWADVAGRVRAVLEHHDHAAADERLLAFSHQAVIMLVRYVVEDLTEAEILDVDRGNVLANTAVTRYLRSGGRWELRQFNDASHLDTGEAPVTEEPDAAATG